MSVKPPLSPAIDGWIAVTVHACEEVSEAVTNRLMELGSSGILQHSCGHSRELFTAYFSRYVWQDIRPLWEQYIRSLQQLFPDSSLRVLHVRPVPEEKWAENWKQYFRPSIVSPRVVVTPPWETYVAPAGKIPVIIDPGMAFGTGTHATTKLVLRALDEILMHCQRSQSARVLDVGTGTGILAIAAASLGAGKMLGIDVDPLAIAAAQENISHNGLHGRIILRCCSVEEVDGEYDLVLANLTCTLLCETHHFLVRPLAPEGYLMASGFSTTNIHDIMEAFGEEPLIPVKQESLEDWHLTVWRRKGRL